MSLLTLLLHDNTLISECLLSSSLPVYQKSTSKVIWALRSRFARADVSCGLPLHISSITRGFLRKISPRWSGILLSQIHLCLRKAPRLLSTFTKLPQQEAHIIVSTLVTVDNYHVYRRVTPEGMIVKLECFPKNDTLYITSHTVPWNPWSYSWISVPISVLLRRYLLFYCHSLMRPSTLFAIFTVHVI